MMSSARRNLWVVVLLMGALPLISVAAAQAAGPVAELNAGPAAVEWQPLASYERLVLTVSGPDGLNIRREFEGAKTPTLGLFDEKGQRLPEGSYTWELRAVPSLNREVQQRLAAARRTGDDEAVRQMRAEGKLPEEPVQSGSFAIANGSFVTPGQTEEPKGRQPRPRTAAGSSGGIRNTTAADQVIPDDLIVQGSACVGLDCVNNENFGFDTIRLKENNLRIHFDDTSTQVGFPANDWRLVANDSASGGSSKFSIEDSTGARTPFTVTAGAATNSIFVDSTGRVGLRTSTPVLDLHINTSNTPSIRLEQNNSGGFTAQTWDIGANEANFFVRDVTGGSLLPFRIRPGAPTSSLDISSDGDVGIGTGAPDEKLHVFENVNANSFILMENPNTGSDVVAVVRALSNGATFNFQAHGSGHSINRFGQNLASWGEVLLPAGNGLAIGTSGPDTIILGTNNVNRLNIDGATGAVTVSGNFTVTGTKAFAMVDPADSHRAIYYAALEGPEAGTYFRGTTKTKNGEAVIELPGYFSRITERERMTVQLTPVGGWGQLFVAEKSPERLVIRAAPGTSDLEFDYLVQGVRKGYLDFEVERANDLPNQ